MAVINPSSFNGSILSFRADTSTFPRDPSDTGGSTWSFGITGVPRSDVSEPLLFNSHYQYISTVYGDLAGTCSGVSKSNGVVSLDIETIMFTLNAEHTIPPFVGTLPNAIRRLFPLVGLDESLPTIAPTLNRNVVHPGFRGSVWLYLKHMAAVENFRIWQSGGTLNFGPPQTDTPVTPNLTSLSEDVRNTKAARRVEVVQYESTAISTQTVFPAGPLLDAQVIQVTAGETVTVSLQLDAWLSSVNQPVPINSLAGDPRTINPNYYDSTNGVYVVSGSDGLNVPAAQWTAMGGRLVVALTEDPSVVEVTVISPPATNSITSYSISMMSGTNVAYNSLFLTGTGVRFAKTTHSFYTGASSALTGTDLGYTLDNPFCSTMSHVMELGYRTACAYNGIDSSLSAGAMQAMFETPGQRITRPEAWYTVENASFTEAGANLTAKMYSPVGEFNSRWSGKTIADFNSRFDGMTTGDFSIVPLRRPL